MGAEVVADDRDPDSGWVKGAQVAAELQEAGPGLARLDVPEQLVLAQLVGGEQVPDALGSGVGRTRRRSVTGSVPAISTQREQPRRPGRPGTLTPHRSPGGDELPGQAESNLVGYQAAGGQEAS